MDDFIDGSDEARPPLIYLICLIWLIWLICPNPLGHVALPKLRIEMNTIWFRCLKILNFSVISILLRVFSYYSIILKIRRWLRNDFSSCYLVVPCGTLERLVPPQLDAIHLPEPWSSFSLSTSQILFRLGCPCPHIIYTLRKIIVSANLNQDHLIRLFQAFFFCHFIVIENRFFTKFRYSAY